MADSGHLQTLAKAQAWLRRGCSTGTPSLSEHWAECCRQLHAELIDTLRGAIAACDALDDDVDGPRLVDDLRKRVEQHWEAHLFDSYINDSVSRLGYRGLDAVAFRKRNLDALRKVVQASEGAARTRLLTQRIEAGLLDLMAKALPVTSAEVMEKLHLGGATQVAAALLLLCKTHGAKPGCVANVLEDVCSQVLKDSTIRRETC